MAGGKLSLAKPCNLFDEKHQHLLLFYRGKFFITRNFKCHSNWSPLFSDFGGFAFRLSWDWASSTPSLKYSHKWKYFKEARQTDHILGLHSPQKTIITQKSYSASSVVPLWRTLYTTFIFELYSLHYGKHTYVYIYSVWLCMLRHFFLKRNV